MNNLFNNDPYQNFKEIEKNIVYQLRNYYGDEILLTNINEGVYYYNKLAETISEIDKIRTLRDLNIKLLDEDTDHKNSIINEIYKIEKMDISDTTNIFESKSVHKIMRRLDIRSKVMDISHGTIEYFLKTIMSEINRLIDWYWMLYMKIISKNWKLIVYLN